MITQFDMNPDGITGKKAGHHRENAVVLVFAGILTDYDG